ncbi:hypothetical protein F5887DRAFT_17982 [Amanita rubescens]|nr:hypothetical protein F5887DRAFT_17982 [Amanita rubescens]
MNFPSLRQLSFSAPLFTVDVRWENFLKAHGGHLQHIQVLICSLDSRLRSDLTYVTASCPNLVRLDFHFTQWSHMPFLTVLPPTVQHLGIFCARGQEKNYTVFFSRLDKIQFGDNFRCIQFLGKRNVADIVGKHLHQFLLGTERLRRLGIRFMDHNGAYLGNTPSILHPS